MQDPLVSVVIPCYNAEKWIAETIRSVLHQSYANTEIIVIDDGSSDNSAAVVHSFGDKVRLETGPNRGGCAARNRGLEIARGEYIQFLDADDVLSKEKIELQLNSLKSCSPEGIAVCAWSYFSTGSASRVINVRPYWTSYSQGIDLLIDIWLHGGYFPSHCWLVPRRLIEKSGDWNEALSADQDGEFFGRILALCGPVVFVPGAFAFYRTPAVGNVSSSRAPRALCSRILATESVASLILSHGNNSSARASVASRWQNLAYHLSQYNMDLARDAASRAAKVMPRSFSPKVGGTGFRVLSRALGFQRALELRWAIRNCMAPRM